MSYKSLLASVLLCTGLLMGGGPSARSAGEPGYSDAGDHAEGDFAGGKWKFHAESTCRCEDNSCKIIKCDGESGLSYEDARFKALLALQYQARAENGRLEGSPSITVRFVFEP